MDRPRRSRLAIVASVPGILAFLAFVGFLVTVRDYQTLELSNYFLLAGAILAALAVILGHRARARIRRSLGEIRGRWIALAAVAIGYLWFVIVCFLDRPYLVLELVAVVSMLEIPRLFYREVGKRLWTALPLAFFLFLLVMQLLRSDAKGHHFLAALGTIELCFLPGLVLFHRSPKLTARWKILIVILLYAFAAVAIWYGWEGDRWG